MAKNRNNSAQSKGSNSRSSSTSGSKGRTSRGSSNSSASKEGTSSRAYAHDDDYSNATYSKGSGTPSNSNSKTGNASQGHAPSHDDDYNGPNYASGNVKDSGNSSRSNGNQSTKGTASSSDNYYEDDRYGGNNDTYGHSKGSGNSSQSHGGPSTKGRPSSGDNYNNHDRYGDNHDASGTSKNPDNSSGSYSNEGHTSKGNGAPSDDSYSREDHYNSGNVTSKGGSSYQNEEPINDPPYDDYNHSDRETSGSSKGRSSDSMYLNNDNNYTHDSGPISKGGGNQTDNNNTAREENNTRENNRSNSGNSPASHLPNHFETCTPFKRNYEEFRETLVSNSSNLRRAMISRSDPSHIGRVIDRTSDLRDIHQDYLTAGARAGDRICLATEIIRDERRYVEFIRFTAPNMHTFDDEPITANTADIQRRELTQLHRDFTGFTNDVISRIRTYFGRPDSHDTTLANAIGVYCNNMIRLSRRERTMIPAEVSRSFASPIVNTVQNDWNGLTNNNSAPALQGQDDLVIRRYRAWARAVLLEHGNTTDETTINNYVNTFNGYRNY